MTSRGLKGLIIVLILVLAGGILYQVHAPFRLFVQDTVQDIKSFRQNHDEIIQAVREEIFSAPLKSYTSTSSDQTGSRGSQALTRVGVIAATNAERQAAGVPVLVENEKLNTAAERKMQDMFTRQYFEHVSPDGHGPGYIADQAGYNYIVVGENLALGNFKDNKAILTAWMNSPGHRANIVSDKFTEIGVAVGQGVFEGQRVWIGVQEFGRPASECPVIDATLRVSINGQRATIDNLGAELARRRQELQNMPRSTAAEQRAYNTKVDEYNGLVKNYNAAVTRLRSDISKYNDQVRAFNACIKR